MKKHIDLQSDTVFVLMIRAQVKGPHVDIMVDKEWWAGASKDHRRGAFIAAVEACGIAGARIIPEEFNGEASMRDLDAVQGIPEGM